MIVLINDGSSDSCSSIFDTCSSRAVILNHVKNTGKGQALKTGLSYIQSNFAPDSVVVTVDADGQQAVKDAYTLCELAEHHHRSLILGCRHFDNQVPLRSIFRSRLTDFMFHRATGIHIRDPLSGLRAFPFHLIPILLEISGQRYDYEINVLLHFAHKKLRIYEYPIKSVYVENNNASHFRMVKTALRKSQSSS